MEQLLTIARQYFTRACPLSASNLEFLPEVRGMCADNRCGNYNKSWVCPPACGTLEQITERVTHYKRGILVQTVGQLEDNLDYEGMMEAGDHHRRQFHLLIAHLLPNHGNLLPMGAGGCNLCSKCSYPDEPCRNPSFAYPSMEAYGLFVSRVCELSGIPYNSGANTVTYTSCILTD